MRSFLREIGRGFTRGISRGLAAIVKCDITLWSDDSTTDFESTFTPQVEGLKMVQEGMKYADNLNVIEYGSYDWIWNFEFEISSDLSSFGYLRRAQGITSSLIEVHVNTGVLKFLFRDNNGGELYDDTISGLLDNVKYKGLISKSGNDIDFQVVGVEVKTTVTADFSAGAEFRTHVWGFRSNGLFHFKGHMYNWNDSLLDDFDFETRTGLQDIYYNTIIGSVNGIILRVRMEGAVSPYLPNLPVNKNFTGVTDLNTVSGDSITSGTGVDKSWWEYQNNMYSELTANGIVATNLATPTLTSYDYASTGFFEAQNPIDVPNGYTANTTKNTTYQINTLNCTQGNWALNRNDNLAGFLVSESILMLRGAILEHIAANRKFIMFTGSPAPAAFPAAVAWALEYTAQVLLLGIEFNIPVVDVNKLLTNGDGIILTEYDLDGVHWTELAQQLVGSEYIIVTNQEYSVFQYLVNDKYQTYNSCVTVNGGEEAPTELCNVTNYTSNLPIPFAIDKAPVNLDEAILESEVISDIDLNDGAERPFDINIWVGANNTASDFVYNTGKFGTSAGIVIQHDGTRFSYKWFNDAGNAIAQILSATAVPIETWVRIRIKVSTTKFEVMQDDETFNAVSINPASSNINKEAIGFRARTGTQKAHVRIEYTDSSIFGKTSFVSNVSDGQTFNSDTGKVYTLTGVATQVPDYEPSDSVGVTYCPVTGDVYNSNLDLIGNRDPITLVFTADPAFPNVVLINDKYQIGDTCVIVPEGEELYSLDFSHPRNSQYIPLLAGGGMS